MVRDPDPTPWNGVSERLARRFFRREESSQPLVPVALAHCVGHLVFRVHLASEPCELGCTEAVARDVRQVDADSDDHRNIIRRSHLVILSLSARQEGSVEGRAYRASWAESKEARRITDYEMDKIRIVPINSVDAAFLDRLAACLEERFLAAASVEPALTVPRSSLNATRGQLFVATLTSKVQRAHPESDAVLLAITDFDLYKTSHRFVFGDADEAQNITVVSIYRLRSEFYGEPGDANLLFQRTLKECDSRAGPCLRSQALLQCALCDVLFELDIRDRQQDAALLRHLRPAPRPGTQRALARSSGERAHPQAKR